MRNKLLTIFIIILVLIATGLGYSIYKQRSGNTSYLKPRLDKSLQSTQVEYPQSKADETQRISLPSGDEKKVFLISVGENTELFGIDVDNPYIGEPPARIDVGSGRIESPDSIKSFEIWGDVLTVDLQKKTISLSADYPRPIATEFTPRGPKLSLRDIKMGDRVVVSSHYTKENEIDWGAIEFIQVIGDEVHR